VESLERSKAQRNKHRSVRERDGPPPPGIAAIQALGGPCADIITAFHRRSHTHDAALDDSDLEKFASALRAWSAHDRSVLLREFLRQLRTGRHFDMQQIDGWSKAHAGQDGGLEGFVACLRVQPPPQIRVIRQLAQVSKQKRVFEARWPAGRRVVLKQFLDPSEAAMLVAREEVTHPLTMSSPYVIESFVLENRATPPEKFVVEEYLPSILPLDWIAEGIDEAANLLFDICSALAYIHTKHDLVHSDVKPDNIGLRSSHYVLLDFGTAKSASTVRGGSHPSGTLRTRAPELLGKDVYPASQDPRKADVWALGATLFHGFAGRFPLFRSSRERPPADPTKRHEFELILRERSEREWDKYVTLDRIPSPLRDLVREMLTRNPDERPSSDDVLRAASKRLSEYLREPLATLELAQVSVSSELLQLERSLRDERTVRLIPLARRLELLDRVDALADLPLDDSIRLRLTTLRNRLRPKQ
jgi:serine/threonine protein kinase